MLVLLASVAFAQESRFEIAAGFGSTQTLEPGPVELSGGLGARFNPNGATFRLSMLESTSSTARVPELAAQIGARARQRQIAVGAGFELDVLRQSSSRTALPGLWCDASFGPWKDSGVPYLLLDMVRFDLGFSFLGADELDHLVTRFGVRLTEEERWWFDVNLTLLGSPEADTSLTTMFNLGHGFGTRKSDSPP